MSLVDRWQSGEVQVETWFERDRAHVAVEDKVTGETVAEWRDEAVFEAFEDGFFVNDAPLGRAALLGERFRRSVVEYAADLYPARSAS